VTEDHYLVVGTMEPEGLLVFDLHAGGPPERFVWPVPFVPFDMAPRDGGGVFVLDRENRRYWELDRSLAVVSRHASPGATPPASDFQPTEGGVHAPDAGPRWTVPAEADAVVVGEPGWGGAGDPIAIETAADGTVLILLRDDAGGPTSVATYRAGAPVGTPAPTAGPDLSVIGHDVAFVAVEDPLGPDESADDRSGYVGCILVADQGGDQSFMFRLALWPAGPFLLMLERYFPMRLFGGKALVGSGGEAYYDFQDRWLPLVEQPRRRYEPDGTVFTDVMDGGEPGCVWHRLMLDGCLPLETTVRVWSAADDDRDAVVHAPRWRQEPSIYARGDGPELPAVPPDPTGVHRTWELLFQRAKGRFARLRIELVGSSRATPRIRAVRVYFPRFSYMERYLPAVYREEDASASFLDRFLANLEGINTVIEDRVAAAQTLFDVRTVPSDAVDWLAHWFELALDPAWDESKRRLLIGHAMEFFQWRGTMRGLQTVLSLTLEEEPDPDLFSDAPSACARRTRIVELYQAKVTPGVALGDPTAAAAPPPPSGRWRPADGADTLDEGYLQALRAAGIEPDPGERYPVIEPSDPGDGVVADRAAVWRDYSVGSFGFTPSFDPADLPLWQGFLARRYGKVSALNQAYQLTGADALVSFDQVELFSELPSREPALTDWFQFQTVVLPSSRTSHRFRVLLPVSARTRTAVDVRGSFEQNQELELARRLVELEKPAHTVFDVKFYWEAFRVGEARLGLDTLVDLGGRSPNLLSGAVLDHAYVGESVLVSATQEIEAIRGPLLDEGTYR